MQQGKRPLTALNFYLSAFFRHAEQQALDAGLLLQEAGIPRDYVDNAARRIDIAQLAAFIIAICDALQDESMALSAWPVPRGSLYMMGKVTIHEATLGKALLQMQRFFALVTGAFTLALDSSDGRSHLSFTPADPERDPNHLFAEMNLLMFHRFSSWLIAENIPLGEVYFSYAPPPQRSEYAFLFPGKHVFNTAAMGFTFPTHYLERPVVQNSGTLKSFMHRCPMALFARPETDFSLASEIYHLLWKQHHAQPPTLEAIADTLGVGTRTLIRHLKLEASSYQDIKDRVRRDKAIHYLTSQSATMSEIAERLGFSDARVFTRAFRSWTGVPPSRYRQDFLTDTDANASRK